MAKGGGGSSTIVIGDYAYPIDSNIQFPFVQPMNSPKDFKHFLKIVKLLNPKESSESKIINLISALLLKNKTMDTFNIPAAVMSYLTNDNSPEAQKVKFLLEKSKNPDGTTNMDKLNLAIETIQTTALKYGSKKRRVSRRTSHKKRKVSKRRTSKRRASHKKRRTSKKH